MIRLMLEKIQLQRLIGYQAKIRVLLGSLLEMMNKQVQLLNLKKHPLFMDGIKWEIMKIIYSKCISLLNLIGPNRRKEKLLIQSFKRHQILDIRKR